MNKPVAKREFIGTVASAAMNKTIVVTVNRRKENVKYHKSVIVSQKYHVHDEKGLAKAGDTVRFVECRPLSKTKRWRLAAVVK